MAIKYTTYEENNYNINFVADRAQGIALYNEDNKNRISFLSIEPGAMINTTMNPALDDGYVSMSGNDLIYFNPSSVPYLDDNQYTFKNFKGKIESYNQNGFNYLSFAKAHQVLKGFDYDHDLEQEVPVPLGDHAEFFTLCNEFQKSNKIDKGHSYTYTILKCFALEQLSDDGQDEDTYSYQFVGKFLRTDVGRKVISYSKALRHMHNLPIAYYKRALAQAFVPVDLPVGTIIDGVWSKYNLPLPPNVANMMNWHNGSSSSSPWLAQARIPNVLNDSVMAMTNDITKVTIRKGSNYVPINKNNLPIDDISFSLNVTPYGSVKVSDFNSTRYTSTSSAIGGNNRVWYFDPDYTSTSSYFELGGGIGGSSHIYPRIIDNSSTGHDTHSTDHFHTFSLNHGHTASFTGSNRTYSGSFKLNTSRTSLDVSGSQYLVQKVIVIW